MASILWLPVVFASCSALLYWLSSTLPALPPDVTVVSSKALRFPSTLEELRDLAALLDHYRANHMYHVVTLYSAAYLFKQAFAVPGSIFLNLLGGAIFGQWVGFLLTCFLSASGATCCFLLAKVCGRSYIVKYFPDQLRLIQSKIEQNSDSLFFFLMFLRLFPMTPNWFLNMASPICGVPTHLFFLSVLFGLMPYNFISVQTGSILSQLTSMDKIFTPWTMLKLFTMATAALVPGLCIKRYQEYRSRNRKAQREAFTVMAPSVAGVRNASRSSVHPKQIQSITISSDTNIPQRRALAKDYTADDSASTHARQRMVVKPKVKMTDIAEIPMFSRRNPKELLQGRRVPLCVGMPKAKENVSDDRIHVAMAPTQRLVVKAKTTSNDVSLVGHVARERKINPEPAHSLGSGIIEKVEKDTRNRALCKLSVGIVEMERPQVTKKTEESAVSVGGESESRVNEQMLTGECHNRIGATREQGEASDEDDWTTEEEEEKPGQKIEPAISATNEAAGNVALPEASASTMLAHQEARLPQEHEASQGSSKQNSSNALQVGCSDVLRNTETAKTIDGIKIPEEQDTHGLNTSLEKLADVEEDRKAAVDVDVAQIAMSNRLEHTGDCEPTEISTSVYHSDPVNLSQRVEDLLGTEVVVEDGTRAEIIKASESEVEALTTLQAANASQEISTTGLPPSALVLEGEVGEESNLLKDNHDYVQKQEKPEQEQITTSQAEAVSKEVIADKEVSVDDASQLSGRTIAEKAIGPMLGTDVTMGEGVDAPSHRKPAECRLTVNQEQEGTMDAQQQMEMNSPAEVNTTIDKRQ